MIDDVKVDIGAYQLAVEGKKSYNSLALCKYIKKKKYPLDDR